MASGVQAVHAAGGATEETDALHADAAFRMLLSDSAEALGATRGELMEAVQAAEALVAGRGDLTEEQKLARMMDDVAGRFGASDLTDAEMKRLLDLCRMGLAAWQAEAAAEEGYEIVRTDRAFADPIAATIDLVGRPAVGRPEADAIDAPSMGPLRPVDSGEEEEDEEQG